MTVADLGQFAKGVAAWRKLMAAMPDNETRWEIFDSAAHEIATYVPKGLDRVTAVDQLQDMATAYGLADVDHVQTVIADAFREIEPQDHVPDGLHDEPSPRTNGHGHEPAAAKPTKLRILSKAKFLADLRLPNYLIDGLLQRGFIYALTGQTGHAKTAVALLIGQLVSSGDKNVTLGTRRVDKGRVIYCIGENADDVGYRIIASDAQRSDDPTADNISFIPEIFDISKMINVLRADCDRNGEASLIIVDTSAAYFLGNEELSNTQMGAYARTLRRLTKLPGSPCVLVLCHPIKHVLEPSQLLPRGGGAYLAEMDGNLTLWRLADDIIEFHHTKIRGPGFQAMSFRLEPITSAKLTDEKGRPFSTVRAVAITQHEEEQQLDRDEAEEDQVLAAMLAKPAESTGSFAEWARDVGWVTAAGEAYKKKVERIINGLANKKPKLTTKRRNKWELTEEGKTAARKAALRFEAEKVRASQNNLL